MRPKSPKRAKSAGHPLLYELNTRCWLDELSGRLGRHVTLANVPEDEIIRWQELGFAYIWLMGVWSTGPQVRAHALNDQNLRETCDAILPDWEIQDLLGSPYAIASYEVPLFLGGDAGLRTFRQQLLDHGLRLVLDFVPNHLGLDHPWITERPELFVQGTEESVGTFANETEHGTRWIAHGKDPYFPAWTDTAQLDYRNPETQEAMTAQLLGIASRCDGVRCDMAMLVLADVFAKNWSTFPPKEESDPAEFWSGAIAAVRKRSPDFLMLAEAYWNLEPRLQALGFDYTYNKRLLDFVVHHRHETQKFLLDAGVEYLASCAHFLENHDEKRIASRLHLAGHRAAALLLLSMPGMKLLHEGQLEGARIHTPVHLGRRPGEPPDPEIADLYDRLLATIGQTVIGHGTCALLKPQAAWPDNPSAVNLIVLQWTSRGASFDLVVVNLAPHQSQCRVQIPLGQHSLKTWRLTNLLGEEEYLRPGGEMVVTGLFLDLPPHGAQIFHASPLE